MRRLNQEQVFVRNLMASALPGVSFGPFGRGLLVNFGDDSVGIDVVNGQVVLTRWESGVPLDEHCRSLDEACLRCKNILTDP